MQGVFLLAMHLIQLTGPEHQMIELNPKSIVSMRSPRAAEHFAPGMHCLIHTMDSKIVVVQERCDDVRHMIEDQRQ
jgi:hypothetical protein